MWEMVIVIPAVLAAAGTVGYGMYRNASGKGGCASCRGCGQAVGRDISRVAAVPQGQGFPEEALHLAWKADGPLANGAAWRLLARRAVSTWAVRRWTRASSSATRRVRR